MEDRVERSNMFNYNMRQKGWKYRKEAVFEHIITESLWKLLKDSILYVQETQ